MMKEIINNTNKKQKILFACVPADGHFNPLTGLAKHLQSIGYDVRWYASRNYEQKLQKLQIPFYPFAKAMEVENGDPDVLFPERKKIKSQVAKLNYDMEHFFVRRGPEYFQDIKEIAKAFPFDLLIADVMFTGAVYVKEKMKIPVIAIGIAPIFENSKDLPPAGLGLEPSSNIPGKIKDAVLRVMVKKVIFRKPNKVLHQLLKTHGIDHRNEFIFDMMSKRSDYVLQSGTPSFEYKRSDLSKNIRFIGSLLPYSDGSSKSKWFDERLNRYERVVLVTQGTVEKDVNKIIIPTLEAFKNTQTLVVCTTGGSQTQMLKEKYAYDNIIVEDFIPFNDVMPHAHVYVTNGGYGGVMLGIENKLPLVVAGVHEGKNEICARVGYFKYGINLKTETPMPSQIKEAVNEVLNNKVYKQNVKRLALEFACHNPDELCAGYVASLLQPEIITREVARKLASAVY